MADDLKNKTIKGFSWSLIDNLAYQGITFVVGVIIANFVTPEEYGLLGIIMVFIALFNSIVDCGFSNALIRKKEVCDTDYNTVFIVNMLASVFLYFLLFLLAPYIATYFHQSELDLLLKVTGIIVVINAVGIIQKTILVKAIDFKTQTKASLLSSTLSGCAGIWAAMVGWGVWSLVMQQILRQLLYTVVIWYFSKWMPSLKFSYSSLKDLFGFGWKLLVSGLIETVWKEINQVVIGRYYKMYALGQYTRAKQFSDGVTYGLLTVIQRVTYPSLSLVQDDDERLRNVLRKIIKMSMYVLTPCVVGLAACADSLLDVLVGQQWKDAAYYLQLICLGIILSPIMILDQNILQVKKNSGRLLILNIVRKVFAIIPILIGIYISIEAMLISDIVVTYLVSTPLTIYYSTQKYLKYGVIDHILDLIKILFVSFFMGGVVYTLIFFNLSSILTLILQLLTGIILFILLSCVMKIDEFSELKIILTPYVKNMRKIQF